VAASGPVRLEGAATVNGVLADTSAGGFRAQHNCPGLTPGQCVNFEYGRVSGRARVVWTRITPDRVESGFLILPPEGQPSA
jgi:hypothetical protein